MICSGTSPACCIVSRIANYMRLAYSSRLNTLGFTDDHPMYSASMTSAGVTITTRTALPRHQPL